MKKVLLFLSLSIFLICGCDKKETIKEENPKQDPIVDVTPTPQVKDEVKIIDTTSKTRPYAVMINCHNNALPQSGLQDAYLVYELMVEGGITRMMALYKDIDFTKVGSVRSARTQYLDYVFENDAIYIHAGGAPDALGEISSLKINDIDVDGKYGVRDSSLNRAWEHTLFTTSNLLNTAVNNASINKTSDNGNVLTYSAETIDLSKYKSAIKANNISIKYSSYRTSGYTYDSKNNNYLRTINGNANTDLVTKKQYTVKNIIAYDVKYSKYTYNGYSEYQAIANEGSGEGYYITNGYAIPIIWTKSSRTSKTVYKIKETGENLVVNDGNTYIQIYPTSGNMTIK